MSESASNVDFAARVAAAEAAGSGVNSDIILAFILLGRAGTHAAALALAKELMVESIDQGDHTRANAYADVQVWMHRRGWASR